MTTKIEEERARAIKEHTPMRWRVCRACGEEKSAYWFSKGNICKACDLKRLRAWKEQLRTEKPLAPYYSTMKSRANKTVGRKLDHDTYQDFERWYNNEIDNPICWYCQRSLDLENKHSLEGLTIDRLNQTLGYIRDNMTLCCRRCNMVKGNWFTPDEMLEIAEKYLKGGQNELPL